MLLIWLVIFVLLLLEFVAGFRQFFCKQKLPVALPPLFASKKHAFSPNDFSEGEPSPMCKFYLQNFHPIPTLITYNELKKMVPERFELRRLDEVFLSCISAFHSHKLVFPKTQAEGKCSVIYEHDHHLYRCDTYVDNYAMRPFGNCTNFCMKLCSDGFLYPRETDLSIWKSGIERHKSEMWSLLDIRHIGSFPNIISFSKDLLGTNDISTRLYFNSMEERFDFKSFSKRNRQMTVTITFEKFYPLDEEYSDDYWIDV